MVAMGAETSSNSLCRCATCKPRAGRPGTFRERRAKELAVRPAGWGSVGCARQDGETPERLRGGSATGAVTNLGEGYFFQVAVGRGGVLRAVRLRAVRHRRAGTRQLCGRTRWPVLGASRRLCSSQIRRGAWICDGAGRRAWRSAPPAGFITGTDLLDPDRRRANWFHGWVHGLAHGGAPGGLRRPAPHGGPPATHFVSASASSALPRQLRGGGGVQKEPGSSRGRSKWARTRVAARESCRTPERHARRHARVHSPGFGRFARPCCS